VCVGGGGGGSKTLPQDPGFAHFPDIIGQKKKQSVYDFSDNFLTHNVWKCGQSLDLEASVLVLSGVETPFNG
jgi:hypothetical protein